MTNRRLLGSSRGGFALAAAFAVASLFVPDVPARAAERSLSESARGSKPTRQARGGGICLEDQDCDDGNACTLDICFDAVCINKPIPGCVEDCMVDEDCEDGTVCTTDVCVDRVCQYDPVDGCTACIPGAACPPLEVVFVLDTSGAMIDEADALCAGLDGLVDALAADGIQVMPHILGVTEVPTFGFSCVSSTVLDLLGTASPGDFGSCAFPDGSAPEESWGPAAGIVASFFEWTPGARRMVIPISDEGPCNGSIPDGCGDPGDDRDAIIAATQMALDNGVVVSAITGNGADDCVTTMASDIANATDGEVRHTEIPPQDLIDLLDEILSSACALGPQCEDGDLCTDDVCGADGACTNPLNYDPATLCCNPEDGAVVAISDGVDCTADACDPATGMVSHEADDTACDDGDPCNGLETCDLMDGCLAGTDPCDDGIDCTIDSCDDLTGACTHTPDHVACDNGQFCDGLEICDEQLGCVDGPDPDCDDGDLCTDDGCNSLSGICVHVKNYDPFTECCDPATGDKVLIDDGNDCTDDVCDQDTGMVLHDPADAGTTCDDGSDCTEGDACDGAGGCAGTAVGCDDGIDCTIDSCDDETGACVHTPDDAACDNSVFCDGVEVCDAGTGCVAGEARDCDDGNACTVDACNGEQGACIHTANHNTQTYCCDPSSGELALIDDGNACTLDSCDAQTGAVVHDPAPSGTACDDGQDCTFDDACDGEGQCQGTDLNGLACEDDGDCGSGMCDLDSGTCLCARDLCLEVMASSDRSNDCKFEDEPFEVRIQLGAGTEMVAGGQFNIPYDSSMFEFVDARPGSVVDPSSPFAVEIFREVDEEAGRIVYSVGIELGLPGTTGAATMASITLRPITACGSSGLCFVSENPLNTLLTDDRGQRVPFEPCCTGMITINDGPPAVNCPESVAVNPDPGTLNALVEWEPKQVVDGCDGEVLFECEAVHSGGVDIDHLIEAGGVFPAGLSEFDCVATDSCGATTSCHWFVDVSNDNAVEVEVQLSPTMSPGPLHRCIEFGLYASCVEPPVVLTQMLTFGLPYDLPGRAKDVVLKVPAGQYFCMTARDPMHTLGSVSNLDEIGGFYVATFKGDPAVGGNWLINGNLDGNGVIDLFDVMMFMEQEFTALDPDSSCDAQGMHSDINGDGVVDQLDYSFIQANYLEEEKESCCATGGVSSLGVTEISTTALREMGLGRLAIADLNGDGWVNHADIALYESGVRPVRDGGKR